MSESQPFDAREFHAKSEIAMIVACSENGVIGREGDLPWHLPDDLRHFMRSTKGCPVIMGRKTFESLDKPLPQRINIVLSRTMPNSTDPAVRVAGDLDKAIELARESICEDGQSRPIWIAGGGTIYKQAIDRVDLIVRTQVHAQVDGDAVFPLLDKGEWEQSHAEQHNSDDRHAHSFTYQWWLRQAK